MGHPLFIIIFFTLKIFIQAFRFLFLMVNIVKLLQEQVETEITNV